MPDIQSKISAQQLKSEVILGLDVGDRRVGVAIYIPNSSMVVSHATFLRESGEAEREILALIEREKVRVVVAGTPLNTKGEQTEQGEKIDRFCRRIERRSGVLIYKIDETLTSEDAKRRLSEAGFSEREMRTRGLIDSVAASIILEQFLSLPDIGQIRLG